MEDIFKIKQRDTELLREFVNRFQRERMMLSRVPDNWAAVVYNMKLRIEEDTITQSRKEEMVSSRRAETEKRSGKNRYEPYMGPVGRDSHSKQDNPRLLQGEVEHLLNQGYLTELFSEKGSSVNIILLRVVNEMQADDKLIPKAHTLSSFDNFSIITKGEIILTTFVEGVVKDMKFQVVEMDIAYNMILAKEKEARLLQKPGYNQIKMDPLDEEKTFFIIDKGTYCYKVMPFGLENVGAAYQRLVTKMFQEHLGKIMENQFEWSEECQQALKNLKSYLSNPPLLAKPKDGEKLLVYLAVSKVAVSAVLVREDQGLGIVLVPPTGETIRQAIKCRPITNNEAEYEAVIVGLELARELRIEQGTYTAREARMQQYLEKAWDLVRQFQTCKVMQIPREENAEADALANLASAAEVTNEENASVIHLFHSVLDQDKNEVNYNNLILDWRKEIVNFLKHGILPEDKKKTQALRKKATRYCLKQGNLYRKIFGGPLARCLGSSQTEYVKREIHKGHCGNHVGGRSLKIKRLTSTPYHPVGNGQAQSTNKVIINNLKKRLEESKGNWPEVLPGVLWTYQTTAKTSTGETPFLLMYGAEALIPVEIGESSTRYTQATEESNEEEIWVNLDLLQERRENALIRMAAQKQVIERYYNRKAHLRYFKIGDYVLKKVFQSTRAANAGKLSPTWEGPYKVHGIAGKGLYELETLDGKILPSNWNDVHLKRYYF
ncbi:uncharacterized protein LOC142162944 [Nicotiana tabacum]|uniref:Uncharacterized protein LOC142162944 n=1 Tax=Nicotiana tabacum TaxID=4097 RepID=A0AC58RU68_TOBAC